MTTVPLPPIHENYAGKWVDLDDLLAYGRACRQDEREEVIKIIEAYQVPVGNSAAGEMACDWTMDALKELRDAIRARKDTT